MKFCTKCGCQLKDDDLFCPSCGSKVEPFDNKIHVSADLRNIASSTGDIQVIMYQINQDYVLLYLLSFLAD